MTLEVLKRNGETELFDKKKIVVAIEKAMNSPTGVFKEGVADQVARDISASFKNTVEVIPVSTIEKEVFERLVGYRQTETARAYESFRAVQEYRRASNTSDDNIMALIRGTDEDIRDENSNKNSVLVSTQRDLIAGEVSKDIAMRKLLPQDVVEAHKNGVIHFHDMDYIIQPMFNCCLLDLKDMLENGTVINGKKIDPPKSFQVACTVMTQIIAQVASSQYGGQSINGVDRILAPYLRKSFYRNLEVVGDYGLAEKLTRRELRDGVQTIQYQINTLMTTNGQSPFVTLFMHFDPKDPHAKEAAMITEEILKQRYEGIKNEAGVYVTPAFPKLIYVLDEHNIHPDSPYYYLTQLAARCTAKRMYPDYISAKKMEEIYEGNTFAPMGCVVPESVITYRINGKEYTESFGRAWNRLKLISEKSENPEGEELFPKGVTIKDSATGKFVYVSRMLRKKSNKWRRIKFNGGRYLTATPDHVFQLVNGETVKAKDIEWWDEIPLATVSEYGSTPVNEDFAWLTGVMVCDGSYKESVFLSFAKDEEDLIERGSEILQKYFGCTTKVVDKSKYGDKWNYLEVSIVKDSNSYDATPLFHSLFGGFKKSDRQLPSDFLLWNRKARMALLAGIVDADGYLNNTGSLSNVIQIGSTNESFALEQLLLVESLGFKGKIYITTYGRGDSLRYRVEFHATQELVDAMYCQKKKDKFVEGVNSKYSDMGCCVLDIEDLEFEDWSYDVTTETGLFDVNGIVSHNCRSFLSPWKDESGEYKWDGRFNMGVVSLNLPQIGILGRRNQTMFDILLEKRLDLCFKALMTRYHLLKGTVSDVSPIHWQYGGLARLKPGEKIDRYLEGGYSTLSLGYIGVYEVTKLMTGESHTTEKGRKFALNLVKRLREAVDKWKAETGLGFALYGTPAESLTYRFCEIDRKLFGEIEDVTDKGYYTNSYHVDVREPIDVFSKFAFESEFQKMSTGGCISYVEIPSILHNPEALMSMIKFIYDHISYAEFNTKSDYCHECGFDGEISCNDNLQWECPRCHNVDRNKLTVVRRTCG